MTRNNNQNVYRTFDDFGRSQGHANKATSIFIDPMPSPMMYDQDGVDHINVCSFAETELGRMLSMQYRHTFTHEHFGKFATVDGFWHWLTSFERDDRLRRLSGKQLKEFSRRLTKMRVPMFRFLINDAIWQRINQDEKLKELMISSKLPFTCYYYHKKDQGLPRTSTTSAHWMVPSLTEMRDALCENRLPSFYTNHDKQQAYNLAIEQIKKERDRLGIQLNREVLKDDVKEDVPEPDDNSSSYVDESTVSEVAETNVS